ncbi:MAG: hypothetical protein NUV50_06605 [Rhodospirillales bacterium]|nr:hypothetical protein [Rhodospirillales bacterium]
MLIQNLAYALVQVIHNLGAVVLVGVPFFVLLRADGGEAVRRRAAWAVLAVWVVQAASGTAFGAVSYYFYARFPELHAIAVVALVVKVGCAVAGFSLAVLYLRARPPTNPFLKDGVWRVLAGLGLAAITAAAFLRWFA